MNEQLLIHIGYFHCEDWPSFGHFIVPYLINLIVSTSFSRPPEEESCSNCTPTAAGPRMHFSVQPATGSLARLGVQSSTNISLYALNTHSGPLGVQPISEHAGQTKHGTKLPVSRETGQAHTLYTKYPLGKVLWGHWDVHEGLYGVKPNRYRFTTLR